MEWYTSIRTHLDNRSCHFHSSSIIFPTKHYFVFCSLVDFRYPVDFFMRSNKSAFQLKPGV